MLKVAVPDVGQEEKDAVSRVLDSGWLTNGPIVTQFEEAYADYAGYKFGVATNSATMAAAILFDILIDRFPARTWVVPNLTFSSPTLQLVQRRAKVRVVDVEPKYASLGTGMMVKPDKNTWVVPTDYAGQQAGVWGDNVIFDGACTTGPRPIKGLAEFRSFYANKVMTCGEGGILLTNDEGLAQEARSRRLHGISLDAHGRDSKGGVNLHYDIQSVGQKANMTDIAAAIGLEQLKKVKGFVAHRNAIAAAYRDRLEGMSVRCLHRLETETHCFFPVIFRTNDERNHAAKLLADHGIKTSLHYPLLTDLSALDARITEDPSPVAHALNRTMLSLPMHTKMDPRDVARVCDIIEMA